MATSWLTSGQVAARLGVPRWRLLYLIEKGVVPGPSVQVPGRRLFTPADVERIAQVFEERPALRRECQQPPATRAAVEGRPDEGSRPRNVLGGLTHGAV
jgi:hypothetical protein